MKRFLLAAAVIAAGIAIPAAPAAADRHDTSLSLEQRVNNLRLTGTNNVAAATIPNDAAGATGAVRGAGGKCLDVAGANDANRTAVRLYGCNGTAAQTWTMTPDGTVRALRKCLDVTYGRTSAGTLVQLYDCNTTGAQQWRARSDGALANPQSGLCLDATGGGQLRIATCTTAAGQDFAAPWQTLSGPQGVAASTAKSTPSSYVNFHFDAASLKQIDFAMTVTDGPGSGNVFWSNQFWFTNGSDGYAGMQTHRGAPDAGQFLYSVWGAVDAKPGSAGTYCTTFGGEGTGRSCRLAKRPILGHAYHFRLTADGGGWFTVTVRDATAGTSITLGSIKTAQPGDLSPDPQTWVEYYDWSNPATMCTSQPYSAATVTAPTGDGRQARITGHKTGGTCQGWTKVTVKGAQAVQENGIGNSIAGTIQQAGRCLSAHDGKVSLGNCDPSSHEQTWTAGSDGSLHPASAQDHCLTAGNSTTLTACTGTANQLWHYNPTTRTVTSHTGTQVAVGQPASGAWTVPRYMH